MARALANLKLKVVVDDTGVPQSATIDYMVVDGKASKSATHVVANPDWNKVLHANGQAGEFWFDEVALIKAAENI